MKKAIIKQTRQTKILQGMFRTRMFWFVLVGDNGKIIATSENYTQKHNAYEVLRKYFPEYPIDDTTMPKPFDVKSGKAASQGNSAGGGGLT